jgi:hypothetical protein
MTETELEPANPVEVALIKLQEVNERLAERSKLVAGGFRQQFLGDLGGTIRGVVQADVGGGIRNYEPFLSDQCWALFSSEESDREQTGIEQLKELLREHVKLLEYGIFLLNFLFLFRWVRKNIRKKAGKNFLF